jgi:predicted MFS family arabinose efflux permease
VSSEHGEFRNGWRVVLAASIGNGLGAGTMGFFTLGVFGPAIGKEFHWGSGQINGGLLVNTLVVMLAVPVAGMLADRFGVRRIVLCSTALVVPAFASFAFLDASIVHYYLCWALIGALGAGTFAPTWSRAVNSRFQIHKGLALGITLCGTGISAALLKPFAFTMLARWGWRTGYVALGCLSLISFVTAMVLVFDVREDPGVPDRGIATIQREGSSLAMTIRQWRFWIVGLAVGAAALAVGGPIPSIESILRELNFSRDQIISLASLVGLSIIAGRLASSYLIDRFWAPLVALLMNLAGAAAMVALCLGQRSYAGTALCLVFIGAVTGSEYDLAPFLVARYLGSRHYAAIYGALYGIFSICTGLGAVLFGAAHDRLGLYRNVLPIFGAILLGSGLSLLLLGPYVFPLARTLRPGQTHNAPHPKLLPP